MTVAVVDSLPALSDLRPRHVLALAAADDSTLGKLAAALAEQLASLQASSIADFCYSVHQRSLGGDARLVASGSAREELCQALAAAGRGEQSPLVVRGHAAKPGPIAFLITGQGSQYQGMGRQLYATQPTFRAALDRCARALSSELAVPLLAVLFDEQQAGLIDETAYTQPALFALEFALAELLASWGVRAELLMGHSVGEYVAACLAGVLELEDALRLIAARARLMQSLPKNGQMTALATTAAVAIELLAPFARSASLAAVNGPDSVVVSGESDAVSEIVRQAEARGIRSTKLNVSHAFHSPLMEPILDDFERVAATCRFSPPTRRVVSNVSGRLAEAGEQGSPAYWRRHLRAAVQFVDGVRTLDAAGCATFVELGPNPVLLALGRRAVADHGQAWVPTLRKGRDEWKQLTAALAELYVRGHAVDWLGFDRDYGRSALPIDAFSTGRAGPTALESGRC